MLLAIRVHKTTKDVGGRRGIDPFEVFIKVVMIKHYLKHWRCKIFLKEYFPWEGEIQEAEMIDAIDWI